MEEPIDHRILKSANSQVPTEKNSSLPIFRLPPETLATIFTYGARDYFKSILGRPTFHLPKWVNVSYVCGHWRNVALGCPALWSYHFIVSLRWTEELLVRSKQASLKIRIHYRFNYQKRDWWLSLVEKILKNLERIEELRLYLPRGLFPAQLSLRAPLLRSLDMKVLWSDSSLTISDGHTPLLHTLTLVNCPLPWYQLNLVGLTSLRLFRVPPRFQHNIVDFLAILSCMQNLAVLVIDQALTGARNFLSHRTSGASPKIDLPHLDRVSVVAPFSAVVIFLSSVNVPLKAETRLEFIPEDDSAIDDFFPVSSLLAQRFSTSEESSSCGPILRSLVISSNTCRPKFAFSTLEHDRDPWSLSFASWSCNIPLAVIIGNDSLVEMDLCRIIGDICHCMPLMNLRSLHVIDPPRSSDFWKMLLTHFNRLRYLKLTQGYMPDIASLLSLSTNVCKENPGRHGTGDQIPTTNHQLVPELEVLELSDITFASERDLPMGIICQESLLNALSTRKGLRDRLIMVGCKVSDGQIKAADSHEFVSWNLTPYSCLLTKYWIS